jgi:hypothetical protein
VAKLTDGGPKTPATSAKLWPTRGSNTLAVRCECVAVQAVIPIDKNAISESRTSPPWRLCQIRQNNKTNPLRDKKGGDPLTCQRYLAFLKEAPLKLSWTR